MKLLRMAVVIGLLLISATGCSNEVEVENNQQTETQVSQKEMNGVFRYSNWGDTIEQVEAAEGSDYYVKGEELLAYKNIGLLTYNTEVVYSFDKNGLKSAVYKVMDTHTNDELYIEDFHNIDEALKVKYGEPSMQDTKWYSDLLKDTPGIALFMGEV